MKKPEPAPILAAGGIVVRDGVKPSVAIVRLRKDKAWVLPKGKLKPGEDALAAARREVEEETGHDVSVHEFLGAVSEAANGRHKVTQFWRMRPVGGPARKLTADVKAVQWLPLNEAIHALTRAHERVFLAQVGPAALQATQQAAHDAAMEPAEAVRHGGEPAARDTFLGRMWAWLRGSPSHGRR